MRRPDPCARLRKTLTDSVKTGAVTAVEWAKDSSSFTFTHNEKTYRFEVATQKETTLPKPKKPVKAPERGRQYDTATSTDGKFKAVHRDRNVVVIGPGKRETIVTTDGSAEKRTKYGIASWVYGEELYMKEAMWWSPDASLLAYYFFDESEVKDFFLVLDQKEVQGKLDVEAYPKAGTPNPKVGLFVWNRLQGKSVAIDIAFGDPALAEYVYDVRWTEDGKELLFSRTNRKQNIMELCLADPNTGECRVVMREEQLQSWVDNRPVVKFLPGSRQFVWSSEQTGYRNLVLADLDAGKVRSITDLKTDVASVEAVDNVKILFTAPQPEEPYLLQLQEIDINGIGKRLLTDPKLSHQVFVSPDGKWILDIAQKWDTPAETRLLDRAGNVVKVIREANREEFNTRGYKTPELFTYTAADGKTELYGTLQMPSDFDPSKKYPLVVAVYGGPESGGIPPNFATPNPLTELGFLVAWFAGRGTSSRGKAHRACVYGKLGMLEIDDQAAGVKALADRPYVDATRIGIYGTSYGGYATLMAMFRYPDVFHAGCACSSVAGWPHYDTIYTERYMGLPTPEDNAVGYEQGNTLKYAENLRGKLMIFYGTADNNVHPNNSMQVVAKLEELGKSFEMRVGPDKGHVAIPPDALYEFFVKNLILAPRQDALANVRRRASKAAKKR